MALTQSECQSQLEAQFLKGFSQAENIGKLTSDAWGVNKYTCIDTVGGMVAVNNFLQQTKLNKNEISVSEQHGVPSASASLTTTGQATTQTGAIDDRGDQIVDGLAVFGKWVLIIFVIAIGSRILFSMLQRALRYGYAFLNAHRLIFLKVLLPRGDGKADREQEKEIAKDMKEKI
ncbi:MAG: hypothetical protein LBD11_02970 [Candidatus Peribacteria bacterium]|jgi:hypothetical protein|nr:hypothetical protein [Candidatus Peribacteria bacterium]